MQGCTATAASACFNEAAMNSSRIGSNLHHAARDAACSFNEAAMNSSRIGERIVRWYHADRSMLQ